ncbi:MAG: BglI family type II restriction endonuclease [Anaerolineales bacterium]|nr:MAG: BglI family type II restriction endonuclease [Anaerolineales bacterium]
MSITKEEYFAYRKTASHRREEIESLEKLFMDEIFSTLSQEANDLYRDFTAQPFALRPFWINYPPEQRGRASSGEGVPWLELGEKTISSHLLQRLSQRFAAISFPGLPTGGDIRFALDDVLVHLDVKLTGPNDNHDEVVVPPNQVSGDGKGWRKGGVINSKHPVHFQQNPSKVNYRFQPKLPPFYVIDGKILFCLTFFLKAIYEVNDFGVQPLTYFELACVPNGFLMFESPTKYWNTPGLIIAGKDERNKSDETKRIRIRLDPLAGIANWRCKKLIHQSDGWNQAHRHPIK